MSKTTIAIVIAISALINTAWGLQANIVGSTFVSADAGTFYTFEVQAFDNTGTVIYEWSKSDGSFFNPIPVANSNTLTLGPLTLSDAGEYRCDLSDDLESITTTSIQLVVNENAPLTVNVIGATSVFVAAGQAHTFQVIASDAIGQVHYEWEKLVDNIWSPISGAITDTFTLNDITFADATLYRCAVYDDVAIVYSETINLTVEFYPDDIIFTDGGFVEIGTHVCIRIPNPLATAISWRKNGDLIPGATDLLLCFPNLALEDSGIYVATYEDGAKALQTYTVTIIASPNVPASSTTAIVLLILALLTVGLLRTRRQPLQ